MNHATMKIQIIKVPYDSGRHRAGSGLGPLHFVQRGLEKMLQDDGHQVAVCEIESTVTPPTEISTGIDVNRCLADQVTAAVAAGFFPLVFSGNCNSCVGAITGINSDRPGIIWFDAHGDFNTPETTLTGYLDGMGLAMATGRCWKALLNKIPGFQPVSDHRVIHVGARDLDIAEKEMFKKAGIPLVIPESPGGTDIHERLQAALLKIKNHTDRVYLHIDMDVMDTDRRQANHLAAPGGLAVDVVEEAIRMIRAQIPIGGCGISSYNPAYDKDDHVLNAGVRLVRAVVSA